MKRITTILSVLLLIFTPLSLYAEEVTIGGIRYDLRITNHTATVIPSGSYNPARPTLEPKLAHICRTLLMKISVTC